MRLTGMTAALLGLAFASCSKPIARNDKPSATPAPATAATPYPAAAASERAMRLYPELAKKGSNFNQSFLELYEYRKRNAPSSLTTEDWPLELAQRTASLLGVKPLRETTSAPPPSEASALRAELTKQEQLVQVQMQRVGAELRKLPNPHSKTSPTVERLNNQRTALEEQLRKIREQRILLGSGASVAAVTADPATGSAAPSATPRPLGSSLSTSSGSLGETHDATKDHTGVDSTGHTYWIDIFGKHHYK